MSSDFNEDDIAKAISILHERADGLRESLRETTALLAAVSQILVSTRVCTDAELESVRVRMIGELDQAMARASSQAAHGEDQSA